MARLCLLCNKAVGGRRAKEHVFPVWLLKELEITDLDIAPSHFSPQGELLSSRKQTLSGVLEGRVCTQCNSEWMSSLESSNQDVLTSLFDSSKRLQALSHAQRNCLARWACKTSWLLHLSSNYRHTVPRSHLHALPTADPPTPNNVVVLAAQHKSDRLFHWLQSPTWVVDMEPADSERIKAIAEFSYKISLQLRDLLLLVAWWPEPCVYRFHDRIHTLLSTTASCFAWHSVGQWPEPTSERSLYMFHSAVAVAVQPGKA